MGSLCARSASGVAYDRASVNTSYWIASTPSTEFPQLEADVETDVAVLGGGIVGVTAALLLRRQGLDVVLLEGDRVCRGATGNTTAKITAGHNLVYAGLEKRHGED